MNLIDKVMTLVDTVKFAAEDAVYSVRNKVLDAVDYVKYDVLKQYPTFAEDFTDKQPKAKKKKTKTKKKKK